ncbi:MAG: BamA/TamA family outer membrane protein [Candidatus Cyclobacteriaceae bacterium M3_2C_046]
MKGTTKLLLLWCLLIMVPTWLKAQIQGNNSFSLFFIGDAGAPQLENDPNLYFLKEKLEEAGSNSAVVFLGDNIYPIGLPEKSHPLREISEKKLLAQLEILKDYNGKRFFIPGNHDWAKGKKEGLVYLENQEKFVENFFADAVDNVFLPDNGCPGPVEISLNDDITLILFDSQWMLHSGPKPAEGSDCEYQSVQDVILGVEDMINRNSHKKIIVASHHPLFSYGTHGGTATLKQHIFPLTDLKPNLYIPFLGIGSIYPIYRKFFGNIQDIGHPTYKAIRNSLHNIFSEYPNLIHVAGHDHNLQYIMRDSVHYLISGSGSKVTQVKEKRFSQFARAENGFMQVEIQKNGEVYLKVWQAYQENKQEPAFEKKLYQKLSYSEEAILEGFPDLKDSMVQVAASQLYEAGGFKEFMFGENYRDVWQLPLEVPVFDLSGYEVVKRGGGQATRSLRLERENGKQFVLRSVDKNPEKALPEDLRETFAADLVQDQISASHPYGAFVLPMLADAAGIYHTKPQLVYLPDDPRLGPYRKNFANTLMLFEERPDDDHWKDARHFGNSKEIYSYSKMLEELSEDNDNEVDQAFVLRNRLFDLIIADWDRHDDQWRWASFKKKGEKGLLFRPIPRDRDQAFFVNEGLLPKIASRKWALPKLEGFNPEVRWVEGFNFNARYFDRSFLTKPNQEKWLEIAEDLQNRLTDQVIKNAIKQWPEEVFAKDGERVIQVLKARRDQLKKYALAYYRFLAEEVDILGSDKHERFEVTRINNEKTKVVVYKTKKEGDIDKKIYERTFFTDETKEIRLYGLDGRDQFYVDGDVKKGIKVRIIGGDDEDIIQDRSQVAGPSRKTIVYDLKSDQNHISLGKETKNKLSDQPSVNEYDRYQFQYNVAFPLVFATYNQDDGIYLGAGTLVNTHGFRKDPYATRHLLLAKYAFATNSFDSRYTGDFTDVFQQVDLQVNADLRIPNYVTNFFGLGNETMNLASSRSEAETEIDFYRTRFQLIEVNALLNNNLEGNSRFLIGPAYQNFKLQREDQPHFTNEFNQNNLDSVSSFQNKHYGGLQISYQLDRRNNTTFPTRGMFFKLDSRFYKGLGTQTENDLAQLQAELAFYHSFSLPARLTFATRFGGGINFGEFEFFQANFLDGYTNLRGYRKTRFAGRSSFYNNTELRLLLFKFRSYIFPGAFGLIGFNDLGRVWIKQEDSDQWHHGYGGGIWLAPFERVVGSLMFGFSEEEEWLPLVKFNFMF